MNVLTITKSEFASEELSVDYTHCSTPHVYVAALALQDLKAPLACTLASGYCGVVV